jgi:hypothetical protein
MPGRETKQHNKEEKTVHKVTPAERTVVDKHFARREAKPWVRFKVSKNENGQQIEIHHPDKLVGEALVMEALASADGDFVNGIVSQLASASGRGREIDEHGLNFMLSVIKGLEPRDQLETMLAAQMAAVHVASMTFARRLAHVEEIPQQDSAERAFALPTKIVEALRNDRSTSFERLLKHTETAFDGWAAAPESCNQLTSDFPRTDSSEYIGILTQRVTYGRSDCSVRVKHVHKDVPLLKGISIRGLPAINLSRRF